jgi:hypothetical protein
MQDLIDRLTATAGIDADTAKKSVGIILDFLQKEAPPEAMQELLGNMPGAEALLGADSGGGGGLASMVGGLMGGGGGIMGLGTQLMGAGLSMGQMQSVGKELFAYGREKAGEDVMGQIAGAVPGLGQFI